jgi:hypothetical protein
VPQPTRRSGADLTPFRAIAESVSASRRGELVEQVSALIEQAQAFAAAQVDATLDVCGTGTSGGLIDVAVLREGRAGHDQELVASLGQQLTAQVRARLRPDEPVPDGAVLSAVRRARTCCVTGATS